ncbi:MAG: CinA family nicotinamide mononucleotide deamidase-related protein [Cellvibrionales bacterium]|nr:CinA family nicotinamide mononucleotide deamidase-related protein [Cellvibrionales bacterium]
MEKNLTITLLMTGNELIQGDICDTNSQHLAKSFAEHQLSIASILTLGDAPALLTKAIERLSFESDVLIINGGMGPTKDDHTSQALADALNEPLSTNDQGLTHVSHWLKEKGYIENDPKQLKQAQFPQSATYLGNPLGSAPAYHVQLNDCLVITTPGVPKELQSITDALILPLLKQNFSLPPTPAWHKALLFGIYESRLEKHLEKHVENLSSIHIGFRVNTPYLEFKYQLPMELSSEQATKASEQLQAAIQPFLVSTDGTKLPELVLTLLKKQQATISTAESCTGGLTAQLLTQVPGSSSALDGGVISYSNTLKQKYLNVAPETLETYGAVSKETAIEMLNGLLNTTQSTYGIAITGIAGPGGATKDKPLGTVFIAYGETSSPQVVHLVIPIQRQLFQQFVALCALDLIRALLLHRETPGYIQRYLAET